MSNSGLITGLLRQASEFEKLAAKKPKVCKFKDGIVICGTFGSKEVDDIISKQGKITCCVADPPYSSIINEFRGEKILWDQGVSADSYIQWTKDIEKHLMKDGVAYIWGATGTPHNRVFFEYLSRVEDETGMTIANFLTWAKRRFRGGRNYGYAREECVYLVKGDRPKIFHVPLLDKERGYSGFGEYEAKSKFLRRTNVFSDITELFNKKIHPAQKPERLAEVFISTSSNRGDQILDPFAGSGSTGLAARTLGRRFILVEQDPKNFAIICKRIKNNEHTR